MINFSRFNSIYELTSYFNSEAKCRKAIFESRWDKHDVVCPFCGQHHCTDRTDGRYHCGHCKANFSVTVGTIFENTKISLRKWFLAMYLISCHKKGISSVQLATDIHVTQKTAWYILHKVRTLYAQSDSDNNLHGVVECDEMYLGGRETNKHASKKTENNRGRSTKTKTPIFGMSMTWRTRERSKRGKPYWKRHSLVNSMKVADTKAATLIPIIEQFVAENSIVVTDECIAYNQLDSKKYSHVVVNHSKNEFAVASYSTNTIEGFWAHFKRVVFGTYHFVSKAYLERYIDEAVFRFNTKEMNESERFAYMFKKSMGTCYYQDVKCYAMAA